MQRHLGEASLFLIDDVMYVAGGTDFKWMLVFLGADRFFSQNFLALVAHYSGKNKWVDWYVATSSSVDVETGKFLRAGQREFKDIDDVVLFAYGYQSEKAEARFSNRFGQMDWASVNLSEMFRNGQAKPIYGEVRKKNFIQKEDQTNAYVFRYQDESTGVELVVPVNSGFLLGMHELGLSMFTAAERTIDGKSHPRYPPEVYARVEGEDIGVYGFFGPLTVSGIRLDEETGNRLYADAAEICWRDPEEAIKKLEDIGCHSIVEPDLTVKELEARFQDRSREHKYWPQLNLSLTLKYVGILRWHGYGDDEIEDIYEHTAAACWQQHVEQILTWVDARLPEIESHDITRYGTGRTNHIEKKAHDYLEEFEKLCELTGVPFDPTPLLLVIDAVEMKRAQHEAALRSA
jgi:hypothetical protein